MTNIMNNSHYACGRFSRSYVRSMYGNVPLQALLIMKLTILLTCVLSFQSLAGVMAQKVDIQVNNQSFKSVIQQLQRQSGYSFVLDEDYLAQARPVTLSLKGVEILDALPHVFADQPFDYQVEGKVVYFSPRKNATPSTDLPDEPMQQQPITGRVTDGEGNPLDGVTVRVKGTTTASTTGADGTYRVVATGPEDFLIFSNIGFETHEVEIANQSVINVSLKAEVSDLDEVVVVGYGTQKKADITGSVASVDGEEVVKSGATNITNSLAGRLPGITATNNNGKPGSGSRITIRGVSTFGDNSNSALVVVDDVVRSLDQIDPNEIASISILKDASAAAVYGSRAANGVILVTTKRGKLGKPTISYNGFAGIQNPTVYPELMSGPEYAQTKNVARQNMGLPPAFSAEEMEDILQGRVQEQNWYDLTLNKRAFQTQQNVSVNGGTDAVKYFMSVGYLDQDGLYDNLNHKRYSARSNVDARINKNFNLSLDIDASRRNNNGSGYSPESIFSDIMAAYPYDRLYNPDGTIFYTREQHPVEEIKTGYQRDQSDIFQATFSARHELPFITGLYLHGRASFGQEAYTSKIYQVPILMNRQDDEGNTLEVYPFGGWNGKTALTQQYSDYNTTTLNLSLNYQRQFGDHELGGIVLFEQFDAKSKQFSGFRTNFPANGLDELLYGGEEQKDANGESFTDGRRSYVARLKYAYKDRYLLEASFRADGSVAFPTNNKYGSFPAVSAGWKISDESFFRNSDGLSFVDQLKLRASYGLVGNDRNVYNVNSEREPTFQYQQVYNLSSPIISGTNAYASVTPGVIPNPNVTWESAAIANVGLDGAMWNRLLSFELDFFYKRTSNILLSRIRSIPGTLGAELPAENYAKVDNKGFEVALTHQNNINDLNYFVKANLGFAQSKVILLDEPANIPDYLLQTGRPLNFIVGYKALGFFQSDEEVADYYPQFNGGQKAGDVKFADINGDGVINADDRTIISMDNSIPKLLGGISFGGSYKGFDLNVLFQGATRMKKMMYGRSRTFFNGGSHNNFRDLLDYWTPENRDAKYPRPWENQHPNNSQESSLYIRDASYLRLRSIDLGYTFPQRIGQKLGAQSLRVYFSGTNLFLFDKMNMFDPEVENTDGAYYPQQRTLNFGINLSF